MSSTKAKPVANCPPTDTNNKSNCGNSGRKSCESPSPTKPEVKKTPPIKAPVGLARGPDLKNVKSKIGSLENVKHRPTGGEKKVESQKLSWKAKPRIGSLDNAKHKPLGGDVKVVSQKLEWKVQSKVGSLDNVKHTPGGGQVKIFDEKYVPSPTSTPTPSKSGSNTPTPGYNGNENGDTLKTLTGARKSAEMLDNKTFNKTGESGSVTDGSLRSTPNSSATSMRTTS